MKCHLGSRNDDLLEHIDIGLQRLTSGGNLVEAQDIRHDVQIGLIVKATSLVWGHCRADDLKPFRNGLALPPELEWALGQIGCLGLGAMEIGPVAARAYPLVRRLSLLRLLLGKHTARNGLCLLCMHYTGSEEQQHTSNGSSGQHLNGPYGCSEAVGPRSGGLTAAKGSTPQFLTLAVLSSAARNPLAS